MRVHSMCLVPVTRKHIPISTPMLIHARTQALVQTRKEPFEDWFTWEDEGKDWRRQRRSGSGTSHKRRVRSADDDTAVAVLARRPTGYGRLM